MTTQDISAVVGNASMTKIFNLSATDFQFDGNSLTDSISSQPLGILMSGTTIDRVTVSYTAGGVAWRIQNSVTLQVERCGVGTLDTFTENDDRIVPYRIGPHDILTVYPMTVDSTANQSNALIWVTTTKGKELYKIQDMVDSTSTVARTAINSQTLGDNAFGSTLLAVEIQLEDNARATNFTIEDNTGGTVATYEGNVRGAQPGAMCLKYNLSVKGLAIPIGKGFTLKVTGISG